MKLIYIWCALSMIVPSYAIEQTVNLESYSRFKPSIISESAIVMDADTGNILFDKNSTKPTPPASLAKMMTMYIASEAIKSHVFELDSEIPVSSHAANMPGSKMFIADSQKILGKDLVQGIIVSSGNDIAVALAEFISGSEDAFTDLMNAKAQELGMSQTSFANPTGLHHESMTSSAYDLAILSRALIHDFPDFYSWYKQKSFTYNDIKQYNRNRLLHLSTDTDGIKTGFTSEAGYCLASSTIRNGRRLIVVTMKAPSEKARYDDHLKLINYAYREFDNVQVFDKDELIEETRIWFGQRKTLPIVAEHSVIATIPKSQQQNIQVDLLLDPTITAPITKGTVVGKMNVTLDGQTIQMADVIAQETIEKGSWISRQADQLSLWSQKIKLFYLS